jgi:hypothetical protein
VGRCSGALVEAPLIMPLSDDSVRPGLHEESDNLTSSLLGHMWLLTACKYILKRNKIKKKLMDMDHSRKKL